MPHPTQLSPRGGVLRAPPQSADPTRFASSAIRHWAPHGCLPAARRLRGHSLRVHALRLLCVSIRLCPQPRAAGPCPQPRDVGPRPQPRAACLFCPPTASRSLAQEWVWGLSVEGGVQQLKPNEPARYSLVSAGECFSLLGCQTMLCKCLHQAPPRDPSRHRPQLLAAVFADLRRPAYLCPRCRPPLQLRVAVSGNATTPSIVKPPQLPPSLTAPPPPQLFASSVLLPPAQ